MRQIRLFVVVAAVAVTWLTAGAQDLQLRYDRPAEYFEEALVIGNGTMGGIVYGGTEVDKISLNDITLWTGETTATPPQTSLQQEDRGGVLGLVRSALDRGDYAEADKLQRGLQGNFSQNYQPLGEVLIHYADTLGEVSNYRRWLDISNATAHTVWHRGQYQYAAEYFATTPDSGMVIRITTDNPKGVDIKLALSSQLPCTVTPLADGFVMDGYAAYKSLPNYYDADDKFAYDPQRGIHFRTRLKMVRNGNEAIIYIVNATSFNGFDKDPVAEGCDYATLADLRLQNISNIPYNDLLNRHVNDYKEIFDRVSLSLQADNSTTPHLGAEGTSTSSRLFAYLDESRFDPDLETFYFQYGRYLLISCSRTPNVPANLQGLWNESLLPPWSSNYTSNINVEENYWPAEVANMPEMHRSLLTFMKGLQGSGERTAKDYYGVERGWCLAHNTDIWAMTNPVGLNTGDPSWANWNMGGAWISTHIWEHYAFSLDKAFLREYYPVLKGAAEFCLGWMIEKDGVLMTSPSTSPENVYVNDEGYHGRTCYGGSADVAMIRECLVATKNAALELGVDADFVAQIDNALSRLMPYKIGKRGNLQEWYYDWADEDPAHRHQSHLFGLYPGHNLTDGVNSEDDLRKAAARTLEIKGDRTTGWSTGWRVNLFARLGDAKNAYHTFRKLLSYVSPDGYKGSDARRGGGTYPNLLDAHSPFQIDGNFGGCAGVIEMLMQSEYANVKTGVTDHRGNTMPTITLLPALPDNWKDGSVKGIRARGGYTVDMEWRNGNVTTLNIAAQRAGNLRLTCNGRTKELLLKKGKNSIAPPLPRRATERQSGMAYLSSGDAMMMVDSEHGGKIVSLTLGGKELIAQHKKMEAPAATGEGEAPRMFRFENMNDYGSTFWPSPQSEWNWPPIATYDSKPYAASAAGNTLTLTSAADDKYPYVIEKRFTSLGKEAYSIAYTIRNESDTVVNVAPWEITRVVSGGRIMFEAPELRPAGEVGYRIAGGVITIPFVAVERQNRKVFADAKGWLAFVDNGLLFVKQFADIKHEQAAPGEEEVEIYYNMGNTYTEIENQGAYVAIQPHSSATWTVRWAVASVNDNATDAELLKVARKMMTK